MRSETLEFLRYLVGLRESYTADTAAELRFLCDLAKGKCRIVEVGVYEGVASRNILGAMATDGELVLVDPYFRETKLERLFNISFKEIIAKRTARHDGAKARFCRATSKEAAGTAGAAVALDMVFIDARHDYDSVLEDFRLWSPKIAVGGVIAFHDSCRCAARPEISDDDGPVRVCAEIKEGRHGSWKLYGQVDSISAFQRDDV
jgi:predicted O-methyltransferase YrrM